MPTSHSSTKHIFINTEFRHFQSQNLFQTRGVFYFQPTFQCHIQDSSTVYFIINCLYNPLVSPETSYYLRIIYIKKLSINPYLRIFTFCACPRQRKHTGPAEPCTGSIFPSAPAPPHPLASTYIESF